MKQLRRSEIRRRSAANDEEKEIVAGFLASGTKSSYYKLSTPLRQFQVKSVTKKNITSQGGGSDYASSALRVTSTPMEIRWPLMAFFKKHNYNESFVKLLRHGSINEQNRLLIDLEEIEETIQQLKDWQEIAHIQIIDFDIVNELKSQYVKAALKDGGPNVNNLRLCLMQYLMSSGHQLQQKLTLALPSIPESPSVAVSISSSIGFSDLYDGPVEPVTPCRPSSHRRTSPIKSPFETPGRRMHETPGRSMHQTPGRVVDVRTPHLPFGTPPRITPSSKHLQLYSQSPKTIASDRKTRASEGLLSSTPSTFSQSGGDTPLNVIKQRIITFKRLQALRRLCPMDKEMPQIVLKAQSFIGSLDPLQPTSGSKRRLGLDADSFSPNTGKKRRLTQNLEASTTDYSGDTTAPTITTPPVKKKPLRGAAHLLGTKAVPKSKKKYVSRVAATQKAKVTRENRALRDSLHTSGGHTPVNKSKRQRRNDKFKQIQEDKFVVQSSFDFKQIEQEFVPQAHSPSLFADLQIEATDHTQATSSETAIFVNDSLCLDRDPVVVERLKSQLNKLFRLDDFKPGQLHSILNILTRSSLRIVISLPTGSGKSLIFQMAALNLARTNKELTVAIFPTLPLLLDQSSKLASLQVLACGTLHSGLSAADVRKTLIALKSGLLDIILLTPEQYNSARFQTAIAHLSSRSVGLVCIDESHCLSEWGHTFRPAYQKTLRYAARSPRIVMMTATASNATLTSMSRYIGDEGLEIYKPLINTQRSDLECQVLWIKDSINQPNDLVTLLRKIAPRRKGIILIYCWMKHVTEKIARMIKEQFADEKVIYYHSGLDEEERRRAISAFVDGKCDICVATEALGIGIDSLHVWSVIHYNLPSGIEQWTQEVGRCNRRGIFGDHCMCHLLLNPADFRARHHQTSASLIDTEAVVDCFIKLICADASKPARSTRRSELQQEEKGISLLIEEWPAEKQIARAPGEGLHRGISKTVKSLSPAIVIMKVDATLGPHPLQNTITPVRDDVDGVLGLTLDTQPQDIEARTPTNVNDDSPGVPEAVCSSVPAGTVMKSPIKDSSQRLSEPCFTQKALSTRSAKSSTKGSTSHSSHLAGKYNEVVWVCIDKADMGHLANSRSADELQVLLTLIDNLATESEPLHLNVRGRHESSDSVVEKWDALRRFERARLETYCEKVDEGDKVLGISARHVSQSSPTASCLEGCCTISNDGYDICQVHRFQLLQCQSEGVEIRCYSKPLEEWVESNATIRFLSQYWNRNSSGIYKIKWIDILTDARVSPVLIDVDLLDHSLSDVANDLHCHVNAIAPRSKVWIRFLRSKSSQKYIKSLVREACRALETNNRIQVNRLNAGYVAFKLGLRDGSEAMRSFTEDYFNWPADLESQESEATLWALPRFAPFRIDPFWLHEAFERKASSVIMAELRFDIEKLVSLLTREGKYALSNESSSLSQCALTAIGLARILIGAGSLRHDYKNAANLGSFWGSYVQYKFSDLREVCHKVLLKLVA